jgi:hypothetical protein
MSRVKKPAINEKKLPQNPFANSLVIPVVGKILENHYKIDKDATKIPYEVELEYNPFVKVYSTKAHRLIVNHLQSCTKELMLWIMYSIEHGKDYIWINKKRYMEECSVSLNTYKKALREMIRYGLLVPTGLYDNTYWINPDFFFKGSRVNKYPKNVQKKYETNDFKKKVIFNTNKI